MPFDKLPSGSWRVRVSAGRRKDGTYRRLSKTLPPGATRAELHRTESLLMIEAGVTTGEGDQMTLRQLVADWVTRNEARHAPKTTVHYRTIARNWLDPYPIGDQRIGRLTTADLEEHFHAALQEVGPTTVQRLRALLSGSLKWANRMGWIATNPVAACSPIPTPRPEKKTATPQQYRAALQLADGIQPGLRAYIAVLGATGCRKSEALALRWTSIAGSTLTIDASVTETPDRGLTIKDTKTHRSRKVVVPDTVIAELDRVKASQKEISDQLGRPWDSQGFIFSKDHFGDQPWRPDTTGKWLKKTGITALMLRHMHPTQLLAAGMDLSAVSARLGHAKTSTTLDIYADALPGRDQEAADLIGDLLG